MQLLNVAKKVFGTANDRELKSIYPIVARINEFEPKIKPLSDEQLRAKTQEFKDRYQKGETLEQLLPEAFAVVREAAWRVRRERHYDVQLVGGVTLHRGRIAEMRTGEGKTLVATLPVYLNALSGKGVHVITVNDYLAKRDSALMGEVYGFLGLQTGVIVHGLTDTERQFNYGCDITYGTNNEFGFDYLRDNMKFRLQDYVQRELNFAIVDEVDSILIDEARTPLIISGPTDDTTDLYYKIDAQIRVEGGLQKETHFTVDEKSKTAALTELGVDIMEGRLGIKNLYDPSNIEVLHHVNQGLRAHVLFQRDVDYVVRDNQVMIVDEFTGRLMPGRRWSDGLHQAIEAKEGVEIENENQTLATITFQNYFRMYKKLAGMTGTADTEAQEFKQIYKLDVTIVPTNRPMVRLDNADVIYKSQTAKFRAVVQELKKLHEKGQPVLVGTVSVEKSEVLSKLLKSEGVKHNVLNAKQHEREADVIAQAGRKGAITIATNMAGRGTDILLGGNPENLARMEVGLLKSDATEEERVEYEAKRAEAFTKWKAKVQAERAEVVGLGGLFILGTERHESRRIDNQLRGRAGRQGDPGESRFYLSFEDDLLRIFGGSELLKRTVAAMEEEVPIEHKWTTNAIANAQKKVEGHNYDIRKHLLEYDDVMNQQRQVVYAWRKEVLSRENLRDMVMSMADELAGAIAEDFFPNGRLKKDDHGHARLDLHELNSAISTTYQIPAYVTEAEISPFDNKGLKKLISQMAEKAYAQKEKNLSPEMVRQLEKMILLTTIDGLWKDHLLAMDHLREGIGLQGYGQKDPLIAYKKEGFKFFQMMMNQITGDVIRKIFAVQLAPDTAQIEEEAASLMMSAPTSDASSPSMQYNIGPSGELIPNPHFQPPTSNGDAVQENWEATEEGHSSSSSSQAQNSMASVDMRKLARQPRHMTLSHPQVGMLGGSAPTSGSGPVAQPVGHSDDKVGRNDPCPCGSGKKYKKCHGS